MSMKIRSLLVVTVILLSGLACSQLYEFNCAARGGVWVNGYFEDDMYVQAYCDDSKPDSALQGNPPQGENGNPVVEDESPQPAASQQAPQEMADPAECSAASSLQVNVSQPETKDNDNETRCRYTVTYSNTNPDGQQIWVFVHKREKGAETAVEQTWQNYYSLDAGESLELRYETLRYKEPGTTWIKTVTDLAPIYATEACKNTFRHDPAPRAQIGYPIEVPCADP